MALNHFQQRHFKARHFITLWSLAAAINGALNFAAEVDLSFTRPKKWYVKLDKKLHIFDSAQDADRFIDAYEAAQVAIEKAKKTSRRARKRAREKVYKDAGISPAETIQIDVVAAMVAEYGIPVNFKALLAEQDYEQIERVAAIAFDMQDEDYIAMLLFM